MKTLIFNGSPRKNGETAYMIRTLQENLGGDFKVVNAYRADIRPCIDCRWCFDHAGCAVKDEWQEVLSYIEECDHIIMASPVYFEEVTGMLLAVMSRLQTYFSARYIRKEEPVPKKKTGAVLLTAGSIGPQGFGGKTTAIGLNIETMPTHIAGMPCAVNINCHVTRHKSEVI